MEKGGAKQFGARKKKGDNLVEVTLFIQIQIYSPFFNFYLIFLFQFVCFFQLVMLFVF
jgi:hypothetical protein